MKGKVIHEWDFLASAYNQINEKGPTVLKNTFFFQ
jgi:hypothetical protein